MNDLTQKFSKSIIYVHWISAILILILFPLGKYMTGLEPIAKMGLIKLHAVLGILILLLTVFRTFIFFKHRRPADLETDSKFNNWLVKWNHNAFYYILIIIGLSGIGVLATGGYLAAFSGNDPAMILPADEIIPLKIHGLMSLLTMLLLLMHVVGVAKHYFITKENTLKRIF